MYLQHPPVEVELLDEWCRLYSGFQYITNGFELMEDVPGSLCNVLYNCIAVYACTVCIVLYCKEAIEVVETCF